MDNYKLSAFGLIDDPITTEDKRRNLISMICIKLGINTMIGYEGIESDDDELEYLQIILNRIKNEKRS